MENEAGASQAPVMISIQNVHKQFGDNEVLRGVDLEINSGDVVCIIGPSGSGKTTLLRCINFLETFQQGVILVDGKEVGYRVKSVV